MDVRKPWAAGLLLALLAEAIFLVRLSVPHMPVFDEVHYLPAARALLEMSHPANVEHPPLAKILIAIGMKMFGDVPFGWRVMSTLAGSATIAGTFALAYVVTGRTRAGVIAALTTLLGFTVYVQARIAMLDGFMAAFVVWGAACLLWAMRGTGGQVRRRWTAGAVLLGLAVACKWTAAPYVAFAAVAYLLLRRGRADRWRGLGPVAAVAILGGVSVAAYLVTFLPAFFYTDQPLTWRTLLPFQWEMYQRQAQVLPHHTYQSDWWTWPLMLRPIWYFYEPIAGAQRGVLLVGNPAVMWGGLVAVAACLVGWLRTRDTAQGTAAALWIAGLLIWAAIPKSLGFYYYYYLPSIWLPLALAVAFDRWKLERGWWDELFLVLAAVLFVHFYPILAAGALSGPGAFGRWTWLPGWT